MKKKCKVQTDHKDSILVTAYQEPSPSSNISSRNVCN